MVEPLSMEFLIVFQLRASIAQEPEAEHAKTQAVMSDIDYLAASMSEADGQNEDVYWSIIKASEIPGSRAPAPVLL
jgi:hypothetical protein